MSYALSIIPVFYRTKASLFSEAWSIARNTLWKQGLPAEQAGAREGRKDRETSPSPNHRKAAQGPSTKRLRLGFRSAQAAGFGEGPFFAGVAFLVAGPVVALLCLAAPLACLPANSCSTALRSLATSRRCCLAA